MFTKLSLLLSVLCALSLSTFSQSVYTPEKGSAVRTSILSALRAPVERELGQKIVFAAEHFNVSGSWAFLSGEPQNASGGKPDWSRTKYQKAVEADMFGGGFYALLRKTGGVWHVVRYEIGCTDVCYADWWRRYKAPKAIFPYTE